MRDQDIPLFTAGSEKEETGSDEDSSQLKRGEFLRRWLFTRGGEQPAKAANLFEEEGSSANEHEEATGPTKGRFGRLFRGLFSSIVENTPTSAEPKQHNIEQSESSVNPLNYRPVSEQFSQESQVIYSRGEESDESDASSINPASYVGESHKDRKVISSEDDPKVEEESHMQAPNEEDLRGASDVNSGSEENIEDYTVDRSKQEKDQKTPTADENTEKASLLPAAKRGQDKERTGKMPTSRPGKPSVIPETFRRSNIALKKQITSVKKQVQEIKRQYKKDKSKPFDAYPYPPSEAVIRRVVGPRPSEKGEEYPRGGKPSSYEEKIISQESERPPAHKQETVISSVRSEQNIVSGEVENLPASSMVIKQEALTGPARQETMESMNRLTIGETASSETAEASSAQEKLALVPEIVFERRHEVLDEPKTLNTVGAHRKVNGTVNGAASGSAISVGEVLAKRQDRKKTNDISVASNAVQMAELYSDSIKTGFFAGIVFIAIGLLAYILR